MPRLSLNGVGYIMLARARWDCARDRARARADAHADAVDDAE